MNGKINLICLDNGILFSTQISYQPWKNMEEPSVQFSSVAQSCLTLSNPMNRNTPEFTQTHVHHQLPEFTQTHVHQVSDATHPYHPLSSPSPPDPNPSQHQGLFQWVNSSHEVAKVLEFQLQHQSFPMNTQDWCSLGWTGWISLQSNLNARILLSEKSIRRAFYCRFQLYDVLENAKI